MDLGFMDPNLEVIRTERCKNCDAWRDVVRDPADGPVLRPCTVCGDEEIVFVELGDFP